MSEEDFSADAALARAVNGYELFGERLKPYSMSRKDAADLMGAQYPFLSLEDADRLRKTGRYSGMKRDAAVVLWLCTIKDEDDLTDDDKNAWSPERAFRNPQAALTEAMRWINSQTWNDSKSEDFTKAVAVAFAVILDAELSQFLVQPEGPKGDAKKKRNTPPPIKSK